MKSTFPGKPKWLWAFLHFGNISDIGARRGGPSRMASLRGCPKALASEGMWRGHGDRERVFKLKRYFSLLGTDH